MTFKRLLYLLEGIFAAATDTELDARAKQHFIGKFYDLFGMDISKIKIPKEAYDHRGTFAILDKYPNLVQQIDMTRVLTNRLISELITHYDLTEEQIAQIDWDDYTPNDWVVLITMAPSATKYMKDVYWDAFSISDLRRLLHSTEDDELKEKILRQWAKLLGKNEVQ